MLPLPTGTNELDGFTIGEGINAGGNPEGRAFNDVADESGVIETLAMVDDEGAVVTVVLEVHGSLSFRIVLKEMEEDDVVFNGMDEVVLVFEEAMEGVDIEVEFQLLSPPTEVRATGEKVELEVDVTGLLFAAAVKASFAIKIESDMLAVFAEELVGSRDAKIKEN